MAIDSATKRYSMMNLATPWPSPLPVPQGGFDHGGRFHLLSLFSAPFILYWRGPGNWTAANSWALSLIGAVGFGPPDANTICIFAAGLGNTPCTVDSGAVGYSMTTLFGYTSVIDFASGGLVLTDDMNIAANCVLLRGDANLTVGGDFTQSAGSLQFDESGVAPVWAVAGDFTVSAGVTGWVPTNLAGHTITVGGDLSLTGPAGLLNLVADGTWTLTVTGSSAVASNVDVAYSDASGGTQIDASDGTNTDSGNTTNWLFEDLAIAGPFRLVAQQAYLPGAVAAGDYQPGAVAADAYLPGVVAAEGGKL